MEVADIKGGEYCKQNYWVFKMDTAVGVNCRNVEGEIRKVWECIREHIIWGHWSGKKGAAVCSDRLNLVLTTSFCIVYFNSMSSVC